MTPRRTSIAYDDFLKTGQDAMKGLLRAALRLLPDGLAVRLYYLWFCRRFPHLKRPRGFSEKLNARKLGRRDPRLPALVDKLRVKAFVKAELGEAWVVPTLWSGKALPATPPWPAPFIVKANHGSGWSEAYFPGDTHWPALVEKAEGWLKSSYGDDLREWHYAPIEPCLLVEPFIGGTNDYPMDFKFLVFNQRVEYIMVAVRTRKSRHYVYYNREWDRQPYLVAPVLAEQDIERPDSLMVMIEAAKRLADGFDFVRVDFYEENGQPKFGEMTFFPLSGYFLPHDAKLDQRLGDLWEPFSP